jgi:tRNA(Ser,Leu) C12 N-acetylase TAN1
MNAYAIKAKIPKNANVYLSYLKKEVLERCVKLKADCIVEFLDGRIILFTDCKDAGEILEGIKGILAYYKVKIFESQEDILKFITSKVRDCKSFAVRSNRKNVEREIGAVLADSLGIPVNLEEPDCQVYLEKRGKFYLLFLKYP